MVARVSLQGERRAKLAPAQKLAFIKGKAEGMLGLPCPRLPGLFLLGQDSGQLVKVCDDAPVHPRLEGKQRGLMRQPLPHGHLLLTFQRWLHVGPGAARSGAKD